ncbi:MAG TPA: HAMP domain-containing sensor histidine kinase, partial [Polyangiaceae bacterium]|nr:HAMP domain-containing sensor histidine kinase [Polyangiaceae bacterium]
FLTKLAVELADGQPRSPEQILALTRLTPQKDLAFVVGDLARLTSDVSEGARRAALIIGDLQNLTATTRRGQELVDLARVARQTVALLEPRAPEGVRFELALSTTPPVEARAGELEQVLLNLADNAMRAVGSGGTVHIELGATDGQLELVVRDDGPGLTDEAKQRAFEPFFTTRPAGEGSGLGLAIVAAIVRAHHGTIVVTSEPGTGARFVVRLPLPSDGK